MAPVKQHVTVVTGQVVDWIAPQFREKSDWPDVRPVEVFEAEFGRQEKVCPRCGEGGDLLPDLTMGPLSTHRCPGPDERAHRKVFAAVIGRWAARQPDPQAALRRFGEALGRAEAPPGC